MTAVARLFPREKGVDTLNESSDVSDPLHSPAHWWGDFAPAVHRWEVLRGEAAPVPVEQGPRGGIKLAPPFAEWLMGLPDGWVTAVPELNRGEQLARIGNGVVPQQAYAAFRSLLADI